MLQKEVRSDPSHESRASHAGEGWWETREGKGSVRAHLRRLEEGINPKGS
jgi:hypothetical protein